MISQYDNELRRLRSVIGKRNSLKSGNTYLGSTIPFGYSTKGKKLIISDKEGKYVNDIFKMYDKGKSTNDIKIYLNKQIDITPRRSKNGWKLETIQKMIRNTLYKGEQEWVWKEKLPNQEDQIVERIKIITPQIVELDLWNRVNERMSLHLINSRKTKSPDNLSLLKGTLKCTKCGIFLNHRFRETNHYYGRCTEKNRNLNITKSNCIISKSLRIEETDEKVLDTIIDVIKNSKKLREEYKIKSLSPKWENEKELKKSIGKIKKYLREKRKTKDEYENQIIDIDFEVRTGKMTVSKGDKLKFRFQNSIDNLEKEIQDHQRELKLVSNSKGWINWIDKMSKGLDKIKSSSFEIKKNFIKENIQQIDVEFDKKSNSHKLNFLFRYPIVGDIFQYEVNGERDNIGFRKYKITEGSHKKTIEIPLINNRKKQNEGSRERLNNEIIKLKESEGLSLQKTCDVLNRKKLFTPTKKKWDKPKLSSYYKNLKEKVSKK